MQIKSNISKNCVKKFQVEWKKSVHETEYGIIRPSKPRTKKKKCCPTWFENWQAVLDHCDCDKWLLTATDTLWNEKISSEAESRRALSVWQPPCKQKKRVNLMPLHGLVVGYGY